MTSHNIGEFPVADTSEVRTFKYKISSTFTQHDQFDKGQYFRQ